MEANELERLIGELEIAVDRLRSLYEQYFMGIERIEPHVPRKDCDRRVYVLRKEQIRNTALRFRFQMLLQRYNTYQTHWQRICRDIENGTYKRHVVRAQKRFGVRRPSDSPSAPLSVAPERSFADELAELDKDFAPAEATDEIDVAWDDEPATSALPRNGQQHPPASARSPSPSVRPPRPPPSRPAPRTPRTGPPSSRPSPKTPRAAAADPKAASADPKLAAAYPGAGAADAKAPAGDPLRAASPNARTPAADPRAVPAYAKAPTTDPKAVPAYAKAPTTDPKAVPAYAKAATADPKAVPAYAKAPTADPKAVPAYAKAPTADPKATAANPSANAAPPSRADLAPASARVSPPRPALPRPPSRPAPPPPSRPAPPPPSRPGAPASRRESDLPDDRVRQLYSQYVETRRRQNESTATITYDSVARNLRESSAKLRAKLGRNVDFEVIVKDGRTILRPVVK